jgi:ADP-heptose:LPS heptosyltransferase
MARTLLVYLHGIGDNIMLSGVLRTYAEQHPEEKLDLVVLNPGCAAIWAGNLLVRSVSIYPHRQPYFWNPIRFWLRARWEVGRYIRGLNADGRYAKVLFPTIQTLPEIIYHLTGTYGNHKMERMAADLGVPRRLYPYELYTTPEENDAAKALLAKLPAGPLAVLHPFSGHARKRLGAADVGAVIEELRGRGFVPLVVGAATERSHLAPEWHVESAFGLPFGVLIEVLKRAAVFAGSDSAVAHLAAFANTSRLFLFTPKLKPERYVPVSRSSRITLIRLSGGENPVALQEFREALAAPEGGSRTSQG